MKNEPTKEQLEEWKESRHHDDDGTSRGSFGGPAKEQDPVKDKKLEPAKDKAVHGPKEKP